MNYIYLSRRQVTLVILVCVLGVIFAIPNFFSKEQMETYPSWLPSQQVSLGLDLRGGSHLLLEVEVDSVIRENFERLSDVIRLELRKGRIPFKDLKAFSEGARVRIVDLGRYDEAYDLLRRIDPQSSTRRDDEGLITITSTPLMIEARKQTALEQSIEVIRRRIDSTGVREPTIQRQGNNRIIVQLPGVDDPESLKRILGQTAKLTFHLVDEAASQTYTGAPGERPPAGSMVVPSLNETLLAGGPLVYVLKRRSMLTGENLDRVASGFDPRTGEPIVEFQLDSVGSKRFAQVTTENVQRRFAIVLDNKVITAPVILGPILGGNGQISGQFTTQQTEELAVLLRSGALPAPLTILEERTIGPGLGADSIAAGKIAAIIGMILVVVFMVAYYGFWGLFADVVLGLNILLILGVLSILQATLTLPGIAGIILTVGMAVDANILIFERIREGIRAGRSWISAIDNGYAQAFWTIFDANVTTLIATTLLYVFGSGPVRGFAVTLSIGIITSVFTAIMVTRMMIIGWLRYSRPEPSSA